MQNKRYPRGYALEPGSADGELDSLWQVMGLGPDPLLVETTAAAVAPPPRDQEAVGVGSLGAESRRPSAGLRGSEGADSKLSWESSSFVRKRRGPPRLIFVQGL